MIRIKRVRIVYERLPLGQKQAATLSRQVFAQVQRALEGGPSGEIDRLSPPAIRLSPDRARQPEIVRRTAGAIRQEIAQRLKK